MQEFQGNFYFFTDDLNDFIQKHKLEKGTRINKWIKSKYIRECQNKTGINDDWNKGNQEWALSVSKLDCKYIIWGEKWKGEEI